MNTCLSIYSSESINDNPNPPSSAKDSGHPAWAFSDIKDTFSDNEEIVAHDNKQTEANKSNQVNKDSGNNDNCQSPTRIDDDVNHSNGSLDSHEQAFSGEFVPLQKKRKIPSWLSELVPTNSSETNFSSGNSNRQATKKPKAEKNASSKPSVSRRRVPNRSQTSIDDNTNQTSNTTSTANAKQQGTEKLKMQDDVVRISTNKGTTQILRKIATVSNDEEDETSIIKKSVSITDTLSDHDDDWDKDRKESKAKNTLISDESEDLNEEYSKTTTSKLVNVQKNQSIATQKSRTGITASSSQQRSSDITVHGKDSADTTENKKETKPIKKQSIMKCPYGAKCYRYYANVLFVI